MNLLGPNFELGYDAMLALSIAPALQAHDQSGTDQVVRSKGMLCLLRHSVKQPCQVPAPRQRLTASPDRWWLLLDSRKQACMICC